uniref:Uncharacterized protein n=1 Tax=Cacopsylla melanoneura TaxID=428564 RepID=A0A8D8TES9_9HEMI
MVVMKFEYGCHPYSNLKMTGTLLANLSYLTHKKLYFAKTDIGCFGIITFLLHLFLKYLNWWIFVNGALTYLLLVKLTPCMKLTLKHSVSASVDRMFGFICTKKKKTSKSPRGC